MTGGRVFQMIRSSAAAVMLSAPLGLLFSFPAQAQFGPPTMGEVIGNTVQSSSDIPTLFAAMAYLAGLALCVWAIFKLKDHVINPRDVPLSDALKRFLAGGACFALPIIIEAAYNTVSDGCMFGGCGPTGAGFNSGGATGNGLDAMMVYFMRDVWTPMMYLIPAFCYLGGLTLILIGVSRLLKSSQEGARGPAGIGTVTTFLVAGALLSVDAMMGAFSNSLFPLLGGDLMTYGEIAFDTTGMNGGEAHVESVLAAILAFMMVIGWISFVRGFFILREVAEGNHQASMMAGMTHLFGGAMAVNLGPVLTAVQNTFGIGAMGITFS